MVHFMEQHIVITEFKIILFYTYVLLIYYFYSA